MLNKLKQYTSTSDPTSAVLSTMQKNMLKAILHPSETFMNVLRTNVFYVQGYREYVGYIIFHRYYRLARPEAGNTRTQTTTTV